MARRDDREYREYLSEEQRSQRGCIARRMQPDFHHGLLGPEHINRGARRTRRGALANNLGVFGVFAVVPTP